MDRLLEVRIQKWVMFSTVWNEIIENFREEDLISNRERDYLKFSRFDGFSQAIYLPVFQTAGVVEKVLALLEPRVNANTVTHPKARSQHGSKVRSVPASHLCPQRALPNDQNQLSQKFRNRNLHPKAQNQHLRP